MISSFTPSPGCYHANLGKGGKKKPHRLSELKIGQMPTEHKSLVNRAFLAYFVKEQIETHTRPAVNWQPI